MKVIVDELPKSPKDCIFAEYISMTSKYKCMFLQGLYSRCKLECGEECLYLKAESDKEVPLTFRGPELSDMNPNAYKAYNEELQKLKRRYEMKGEKI